MPCRSVLAKSAQFFVGARQRMPSGQGLWFDHLEKALEQRLFRDAAAVQVIGQGGRRDVRIRGDGCLGPLTALA